AFSRSYFGQRTEVRPGFNRFALSIEKSPPHGPCQAKPAIICSAAAYPNKTSFGPMLRDSFENRAQSESIEFKRMKSFVPKHRQADDFRRFDDCSSCQWFPPPAGSARTMRGIDGRNCPWSRADKPADHFAKAIA